MFDSFVVQKWFLNPAITINGKERYFRQNYIVILEIKNFHVTTLQPWQGIACVSGILLLQLSTIRLGLIKRTALMPPFFKIFSNTLSNHGALRCLRTHSEAKDIWF